MGVHGFRFGVTNWFTGDLATWVSAARRAEALGYATFLLPDTAGTPAPLPALAAAAASTTRLHVGTWVLCDPLRDRRVLSWGARSLHELLGDRFELGLGAGRPGAERDAAALGVPFGSPGERLAKLEATLELVASELPQLRVLVAASGPRMLALAGRHADVVALGWPPDTDTEAAAGRIEVLREAAGERFEELELAAGLIAVGDAETPWLARMGVDPEDLAARNCVTVLRGAPQDMADALLRRRDRLGLSYLTVPANATEAFAPVVELLSGR